MGTTVSVLAPESEVSAVQEVRDLFALWDRRLSRFRPDSELSAVNRAGGRWIKVSGLFLEVIGAALEAAQATNGLFDPGLAARLEDLGYDRTFAELPWDAPARALRPAKKDAWRRIEVDDERSTIRVPHGVCLDFGGIAKGMAVDAGIARLAARGIQPAVVEAGGDLAVNGLPSGEAGWSIAIELSDGGRETLSLPSGALATSSIGRRRWMQGGVWQHHLIDPRTGLRAQSDLWSVTVGATSCREAEVAAKVALILGTTDGAIFLTELGMDGLLVPRRGPSIRVQAAVAAPSPP